MVYSWLCYSNDIVLAKGIVAIQILVKNYLYEH